jgi:hypothetical protein
MPKGKPDFLPKYAGLFQTSPFQEAHGKDTPTMKIYKLGVIWYSQLAFQAKSNTESVCGKRFIDAQISFLLSFFCCLVLLPCCVKYYSYH